MSAAAASRHLASPRGAVSLAFSPQAVAGGRSALRAELGKLGLPRTMIDDTLLVASELLSNSVRYARPLRDDGVRLTWSLRGSCVEVRVSDGGGTSHPQRRGVEPTDTGGRGLSIVETLSNEWGAERRDGGMTVWAVVGPPTP